MNSWQRRLGVASGLALAALIHAPGARAIGVEVVAFSGALAPDGELFGYLRGIRLGAGGALAFAAYSAGEEVIWSRAAGAPELAKQPLAPRSGSALKPIAVKADGSVAYADGSAFSGAYFSGNDLWVPDGSGGYTHVAGNGDPAASLPGETYFGFNADSAVLTEEGGLLFGAGLRDTDGVFGNDSGVWGPDGAGGLRLVARSGDPLPGVPGETYDSVGIAAGNAAGDLVLHVGLGSATDLLAAPPAGPARVLARVGEPAPGSQSGAVFASLGRAVVTEGGVTAFTATTAASESGVWSAERDGEVALLFESGGLLPGSGDVLMGALSSVQLDDGGNMAFVASLFGNVAAGSRALLGPDLDGGLRVLARTGDPLPGVAGATFGAFNDVAMNESGDVIALVSFRSGRRMLDAYVVFAAEGDVWVVAEGAPYEIAPGEFRAIAGLGTLDLQNGSFVIPALELDDSRHFAFEAWFLDETGTFAEGQGLFLVSVPEPGTALLVLLGLLALSPGKLERADDGR